MRIRWTVGQVVLVDVTLFEMTTPENEPEVIVVHHYHDEEEDSSGKTDDPGDLFGG